MYLLEVEKGKIKIDELNQKCK